MIPNSDSNNHDHATTNLKVVLLIFVLVLVGALGYLVWAQNNETVRLIVASWA